MKLSSNLERVKFAREAGAVRRCHTQMIVGSYDVAQHVFGMISLLRVLHPEPSVQLIWACHSHDVPERWTGDIPRPAKWAGVVDRDKLAEVELGILRDTGFEYNLTQDEESWLLGLDILELYLWTLDQLSLGNRNAQKMRDRIDRWFSRNAHRVPEALCEFYWDARKGSWEMIGDLGDDE